MYETLRAHYLHICRGYWSGTTCMNKRHAQQGLVELRQARAIGLI